MPLVEIEDTEVRKFNERLAVAENWKKSWEEILSDPELHEEGWRLFKKKHPNIPTPIDSIEAGRKPVVDEIAKVRAEFAEYKEAQEKERAERAERDREGAAKSTIASSRRKLKSDGWDDEGIEKVEALMQERGIGDYDVAAAYVRSQIPAPSPLANDYNGRDLNWFHPGDDEPDSKLLMENPAKFKSDMVKKFFSDRQTGNKAAWAA